MIVLAALSSNYLVWWAAQLVAVAILIFLFLRWRPKFLGGKTIGETLGQALDNREDAIREQLDAAQKSREEASRIHELSQKELATAHEQSEVILKRAEQTSQAIQQEIEERSREEYERIVGQARSQIEYEREQAELALRTRAADIVVDAAKQVIERNMDPQADRRVITDSLEHLKEVR
jgi:F-type H+-transporting ATPase subunit b